MDKSKILVVDDTPSNLVAIKQTLKDVDVEVITATSGQEALRLTLHEDFALIILDVKMPEMDGYELAELLRGKKKTQHIPIMFLSAVYSAEYSLFKGYKTGAVDFLTHPVEPKVLINKVKVFVLLDQQKKVGEQFLAAQQNLNDELIQSNKELKETEKALKVAKEQAESASLAKSRFLANLTHDIRTPLGAIVGFNQILLEKSKTLSLPEDFQKLQQNIQVSAQYLLEIVNNFLDISKIEAGKMELTEEDFNLKAVIDSIATTYEFIILQKGVTFTVEIDPKVPAAIHTDRVKLNQILTNLIGNAIKFTPQGKEIKLKVKANGDSIQLIVEDQGIGISKKRQQAVFDAFEQAENSISHEYGGTGLGLAITKMLTEMLGGNVSVTSPGLNKGATFSVEIPFKQAVLPIKTGTQADEDKPAGSKKPGKSKRILVVEDNALNQSLISEMLKTLLAQEPDIHFADDGREGVDKTLQLVSEDIPPDLILMDIRMPVMGGLDATREIRENKECRGIPIVILSADAFMEQRKKALDAGVDDYLTKPIDTRELKGILAKYLAA